jgi:sugar lactone lactonase YvrE
LVNYPSSVALDAAGNLYIADKYNDRIRRVDAGGVINTVAGNGSFGSDGDGGAATAASLNAPTGVAVDAAGNVFIADSGNHRIRRVDANGIITTVAGNGSSGFTGDGGAATAASLSYPQGVALDTAGNLYIADTGNHRIRRVNTIGVITTVAGNGSFDFTGDGGAATAASLSYPQGVALDTTGRIYVADSGNRRIRMVSASGVITTVAGNGLYGFAGDGGAATAAVLSYPQGVALDAAGNFYIADTGNQRIRKVDAGGVITTVAGNGSFGFAGDGGIATAAKLGYPQGVALDAAGNLYIADQNNQRIRKVAPSGLIGTVAGNGSFGFAGDGGVGGAASLSYPQAAVPDAAGNLYIADTGNNVVRKLQTGGVITTVAGNGLFGFSGDGGAATAASLNGPGSVATDVAGNLYIADTYNHRIRKVDTNGVITTAAGNGVGAFAGDGGPAIAASINTPTSVALDAAGNLYIADSDNNRVRKVDTNGVITTVAGNGSLGFGGDGRLATTAILAVPNGVALDAAGNLYIADTDNHRVRIVDTTGTITTMVGNGAGAFAGDGGLSTSASLNLPTAVALDAAGNLYIADTKNQRIRRMDTVGIITTVAGNGLAAFTGDGGTANGASLSYPQGVAIGGNGSLFIADSGNGRIRKVGTGFALTVSRTGAGTGTATSTPAAANCGSTCSVFFDAGTSVSLTATSSPGSLFIGWSGACTGTGACSVTMSQARSVTAAFDLDPADTDGDGIPNGVEAREGRNPSVKDNDVFSPGPGTARLFVMQQYRDFLGREGDPAGIQGWVGLIVAGTYTRPQVIDAFLRSQEFSGSVAPVVRLYFATFLRVPDYAGLTFNAGLVKSGTITLTQLADFFTASPEFAATYGALDNTQFVTLLYSNVLGRAPDAAGLSGWVSLLGSGYSRGQVLLGFSDSPENQAAIANEVFVTMMYAGMLRRTPDPSGFSGWVGLLDAGAYVREQVINGFFLSTEYHNRFLP